MKIAFLGKGGSGKTSMSGLFSLYAAAKYPTLVIDADINVNLPLLLDAAVPPSLSDSDNALTIKERLIGSNQLIGSAAEFKKSTPPGKGSNLIYLDRVGDSILSEYVSMVGDSLSIGAVGTYEDDGIGTSCYHNNLAILENILSHTDDSGGVMVVDMVAGTDAFASTLHAQFDMLVVCIEPTLKSIDVYKKFAGLARAAGVEESVRVVLNNVESEEDIEFIAGHIGISESLGVLYHSKHLVRVDRGQEKLSIDLLEPDNKRVFKGILSALEESSIDPDAKLQKLWQLHEKYVRQEYVKLRHGDLTSQIDDSFSFKEARQTVQR